MGKATELSAAAALAFFKGSKITVQTAKPGKARGEDGKERPVFKTDTEALAEEHIVAAKDYGDRVTIVAVDGQRHEARKKAA